MRTWQFELAVVSAVLAFIAFLSGGWAAWVGAAAVALSFAHAQVATRLQEKEEVRPVPEVECHRWLARYFVSKEALWAVYFIANRSWPALAGVALFISYPFWRRWWKARTAC
jgi:hypothetical protein